MQQWLTAEEYRSPELALQCSSEKHRDRSLRRKGKRGRVKEEMENSGETRRNKITRVGRAVHDAGELDPSTCFPNEKLRLQKAE